MKNRGLGVIVALAGLASAAPPLAAQFRPQTTAAGDGFEVGYGTWRLSDEIPQDERDRDGWSVALSGPRAVLEFVYVRASGNAPGFLGLLGYRPHTWYAGILSASLGLGMGEIHFGYSDDRAKNEAACDSTPGCVWDSTELDTGWATVGVGKVSAAISLGPLAVGPWATGFFKLVGANVHSGRKGPWGYGLQAKVRF